MKKYIKSIISVVIASACACGIIACGAREESVDNGDSLNNNQLIDNIDNSQNSGNVDNDNNGTNNDGGVNGQGSNESGGQKPQKISLYSGAKVLDDSDNEVYCTTWQQIVQNDYAIKDYTITLDINKRYKFQGCLVSEEFGTHDITVYEGPVTDLDGKYAYDITYEKSVDFNEENIAIDNTDCGYYEFNFMGLQKGECFVKLMVTITRTNSYNSIYPYNITFIFE